MWRDSAAAVAGWFEGGPLGTVVLDAPVGAASALKMTYAAYTKGTSALVAAILSVARREGVLTALLEEWRASQPLLLEGHERQLQGAAPKAWRWAGEMEEIAPRSRPPGCRGASTAPRPTSTVASRTTATQTARRPRTSSPPCWATESPSVAQRCPALPCPARCPARPALRRPAPPSNGGRADSATLARGRSVATSWCSGESASTERCPGCQWEPPSAAGARPSAASARSSCRRASKPAPMPRPASSGAGTCARPPARGR